MNSVRRLAGAGYSEVQRLRPLASANQLGMPPRRGAFLQAPLRGCRRELHGTATVCSSRTDEGASAAQEPGPLAGLKVLDLTRILAGPYCTMMLGDLGAEVVKIERPKTGDDTRSWGPPFTPDGESAYFLCINRNKKSITVNFQSNVGRDIVKKLACEADVFIENFIPGKLASMGLGYDDLSALNPRLVYASISGFGPEGPYASRAGFDVIASAMGGLMHITGPKDGDPVKVGVAMTDISTGQYAQGAIMAALLARARTGRGQKIDCSLLESQVANLVNIASNFLIGGREARRWGTEHESIVPYQAFRTASGPHLIVGAGSNRQWELFCRAVGLEEMLADERFASNARRVEHREEVIGRIQAHFDTNSTAHWCKRLEGSGIPYGPINNIGQVFEDPQVRARDMVLEVDHPKAGTIKVTGFPVKYSDTKPSVRLPPPGLGEHTDEVLRSWLSSSDEEIRKLHHDGAV